MNNNFDKLEHRLLTPIAQGGTFLNPAVSEKTYVYNGTLLTYFLATHGGDPFAYLEFLKLNHTTGFQLKDGTRVRVPQIDPYSGFQRHPES